MNIQIDKKTLALLSTFLFLSLVATPGGIMNTIRASQIDNRYEIMTQACDIMKETTATIRLTTKQIQEIQRAFDDLKNHLSITTSAEETQVLLNDTVIILYRNHLLPAGMSIEHAKRLVNRATALQKRIPSMDILTQKDKTGALAGTIQNSLCSIAGNTSNTHCAKLATRIAHRLFAIMDYYSGNTLLVKVATALWTVLIPFSRLSEWGLLKDGYRCGVSIYFGNYHYYPYPNWFSPAQGWLSTSGINGKQDINGSFWGQTMIGGWQPQDDWYMNNTWRGCMGFTGLITHIGNSTYYLGSAIFVNVGPDRP